MRFEWDERKNAANIRKHGLDFVDAWQVFAGILLEKSDERIDYGENRSVGTGMLFGVVVVVVFTEPNANTIRIISLRKATRYERIQYEQTVRDRLGPT